MQPSRLHGLLPVRRDVVGEVVGVRFISSLTR